MPLTKSVPSPSEVQATFAATLVDEWVRDGLSDVVICPGSRSTPLAVAFAERGELRVHVRIDERSAGFFAIGRALVTKRPVVVLVTSGTAAAELHACVAEADQAEVPLIIVTADRPPELHGVGAPQTINQRHLYGDMVRCFEEPGVARVNVASTWRALASRLFESARGGEDRAGPVHLNAAFVEPLLADAGELPRGRAEGAPWHRSRTVTTSSNWSAPGPRILAIVGRGTPRAWVQEARAHHWMVVGDATTPDTLAYADGLLRSERFALSVRPDVVVRVGGLPSSKILLERWREWQTRTVGFRGAGFLADPERLIEERLDGLPAMGPTCRGDEKYVATWQRASALVAGLLERADESFSEIEVARTTVEVANESATPLVIGSSMPVRDVEWWAPPRDVSAYSNRGVSGIDGVVSTALGIASGARAIALVGDVTMLHDVSALVDGLGSYGGTLVMVVVNNQGGGIFSFLTQSSMEHDRFEMLFGTPRAHDLERVSTAFGHHGESVKNASELRLAIERSVNTPGVNVVVANVPGRGENVESHRRWNELVIAALEGAS